MEGTLDQVMLVDEQVGDSGVSSFNFFFLFLQVARLLRCYY